MADAKSTLTTFIDHILGELSMVGKFAALFGTLLLISAIAAPGQVRILGGLDLVFLTVADHLWRTRDPGIPFPTGREFYRKSRFWKCFWAAIFFLAFLVLGYYCLKLPQVSDFLTAAGMDFLVPGHRREPADM